MYPFHDDGFVIVRFLDLVFNLLGSILACIIIDGYVTAFSGELFCQQRS